MKALGEMGRVLKSGVVGLNTIDFGSRAIYPDYPANGKFSASDTSYNLGPRAAPTGLISRLAGKADFGRLGQRIDYSLAHFGCADFLRAFGGYVRRAVSLVQGNFNRPLNAVGPPRLGPRSTLASMPH